MRMNRFSRPAKGSRDKSEPGILEAARDYGYLAFDELCKANVDDLPPCLGFFQLQDAHNGFDVLFRDIAGYFAVEVKTPRADGGMHYKRGEELGDREKMFQYLAWLFGVPYHVIWTPGEMQELLQARLSMIDDLKAKFSIVQNGQKGK